MQRRVHQRLAQHEFVQFEFILQVALVLAELGFVERRLRDVDVAALDQFGHLPVEKRQQQRADVRTVDVRVGHDNDAVVAQLFGTVLFLADAAAERGDQRGDLGRAEQLVEARLLDVEDLAFQRQDRLELAVAPLLGGAAGRIALDQVKLAQRRVLLLAVGELAGQPHAVQHALAARHFARLARRLAGARRIDDLGGDHACIGRPLIEEFAQLLRDDFLDHRAHLRGNQLFLGLGGEFRLGHLHRQHAGEPLAHVVAGGFDLGLLRELVLLDVLVQDARHRRAQTGQVRAAVLLRDVVGEAQHAFLIGVVPLHGHVDRDAFVLAAPDEHARMQHGLGAVHVLDEALHAAGEGEVLLLAGALVDQHDLGAVVEEGELAQAPRQDVVVVVDHAEDAARGEEVHLGAALLRGAGDAQRTGCDAVREFDLVHLAVAPDGQAQPTGKRVHHRDAHAMQAAGHLVGVRIELAPRVQLGHDDLGGGALELVVLLDAGRDAAAVIQHRYRIVGVDRQHDLVAVAAQRLVDRVVHHLEHHVVHAGAIGGIADVHAGALAHRLEALQDLDAVRVVVVRAGRLLFGFSHPRSSSA